MYLIEEYDASFSFRALRYFKFTFSWTNREKQMSNYAFVPENPDYKRTNQRFRFIETGINVNSGLKKKFMESAQW